MLLCNPWLSRCHSRHKRREWFGTVHLHIARLPALLLLGISEVQEHEQTRNYQKEPNPFDQNVWLRHTAPPEIRFFFPPSMCGEMLDSALHPVALATGF